MPKRKPDRPLDEREARSKKPKRDRFNVSPICRLLKSIAFNTESGEDSVLPISSQECTGTTPGPPRRSAGAQGAASSSSSLSPSPPVLQASRVQPLYSLTREYAYVAVLVLDSNLTHLSQLI